MIFGIENPFVTFGVLALLIVVTIVVIFIATSYVVETIKEKELKMADRENEALKEPVLDIDEKIKKEIEESAKRASEIIEAEKRRKESKDYGVRQRIQEAIKKSNVAINDEKGLERIVHEEILKHLANQPEYHVDPSGKRKMIVPLEALAILNKNTNPLVNEHGEIVIEVKEDPVIEDIKRIIMEIKKSNDILYASDEELIEAVKQIILISRKKNIPVSDLPRHIAEGTLFENGTVSEKTDSGKEKTAKEEDGNKEKSNTDKGAENSDKPIEKESETVSEHLSGLDLREEIEADKEERSSISAELEMMKRMAKEEGAFPSDLSDTGMLDIIAKAEEKEEEVNSKTAEPEHETDKDVDEIIVEPKESADTEAEKENEGSQFDSVVEMISSLRWMESPGKIPETAWRDENQIVSIFSKNGYREALANNIVKCAPLPCTSHKDAFFVDGKILFYAISRLYGADWQRQNSRYKKIKQKAVLNAIVNNVAKAVEEYNIDLGYGKGTVISKLKKEGEESCYYGEGIWLSKDFFAMALDGDKLDFYLSNPLNGGFFHNGKKNKEDRCKYFLVGYSDPEVTRDKTF